MVAKSLADSIKAGEMVEIGRDLEMFLRRHLLDAIACSLAGAKTRAGRQIIDKVKGLKTVKEATIIGDGSQISAKSAYKISYDLGNLHDLGDRCVVVPRHPGRHVIYAGLAAAEQLDVSIEDLCKAIACSYELILQMGHSLVSFIWPENEPHPRTGMEACCSLAGLAAIAEKILKEQLGETGENTLSRLILNIFALLKSQGVRIDKYFLQNNEMIGHCREMISQQKVNKSSWRNCLTRRVGFQLSLFDCFMEAPTRILFKLLPGNNIQPEEISQIILKGIIWLNYIAKERNNDIKTRTACIIYLCIEGLNPFESWYLNGPINHPAISELASKVLLVKDLWDFVYHLENRQFQYMIQMNKIDGMPLEGKLIYEIGEIRSFRTEGQFKDQFKSDVSNILGRMQAEELSRLILRRNNIKISRVMKLTYPRIWPVYVLKKWWRLSTDP